MINDDELEDYLKYVLMPQLEYIKDEKFLQHIKEIRNKIRLQKLKKLNG